MPPPDKVTGALDMSAATAASTALDDVAPALAPRRRQTTTPTTIRIASCGDAYERRRSALRRETHQQDDNADYDKDEVVARQAAHALARNGVAEDRLQTTTSAAQTARNDRRTNDSVSLDSLSLLAPLVVADVGGALVPHGGKTHDCSCSSAKHVPAAVALRCTMRARIFVASPHDCRRRRWRALCQHTHAAAGADLRTLGPQRPRADETVVAARRARRCRW